MPESVSDSPSENRSGAEAYPAERRLFDDLPLSRSGIDRDHLTRVAPDALDILRADAATRVVVLSRGRALLQPDTATPRLALLPGAAVPEADLTVYLGRVTEGADRADDLPAGTPVLAAVLAPHVTDLVDVDPERWGDLRLIGADLDALDAGLFTEALAIANWHDSHGFSPRTGEPTVPGLAGWVRYPAGHVDEASGHHIFPRTDPAVIVGVVDHEDRLLLGANRRWGGAFFSVLAGFVEPGESFEATVQREVFEEAGLRVTDPVYLGSQPWPFPASVMVGFRARLAADSPTEPVPDGVEIAELRWVTRDEMRDGARAFGIPSRSSIARSIIEDWFGGPLDAP
ncbi:NAD(+) diphosphatase [Herbiconiux sp. L3-i23]|uniref:NAD(+) diphosphatase n=1 Tax=Herbiconiux sp. L3-i23 TaxID=2905871 RepID=UPI002046C135|nr:NAD(+) diphosphatase [Herbiconiux sp. L3-i23]BDI23448.1 putative NADH pyrophosphatase/NUDIX hydrolase [Herbiconiux sp. L3-i23]